MSVPLNMQQLQDEFAFLEDWEDRYRYVIDLGKAMPALPDALKTKANKIQGCVSQVWLIAEKSQQDRLHFQADSDAHIVRGLIAVLLKLVEGKTAAEIRDMDLAAFFNRIGMADNLSPQRANGLTAMIQRIYQICDKES